MEYGETETIDLGLLPVEVAEFRGGLAHDLGDRRLWGKSKYALRFKLYAVLHGRLSSGSDELASLIMMEVQTLAKAGEAISEVMFSMQFSSLTPDQPDPEVLDIMPYQDSDFAPAGLWQFGRENHRHPDRKSNQIVGTTSLRGRDFGPNNTVTWRACGSAVRPILRPAVLLRRNNLESFQASCQVQLRAAQKWQKGDSKFLGENDAVRFDPAISLKSPSMVLDNLQEFMRSTSSLTAKPARYLLIHS
jgi:hypothetical protein